MYCLCFWDAIVLRQRLCEYCSLQLPCCWIQIIPSKYQRLTAVGGLTIGGRTACFTIADDAQERSALILSGLKRPRKGSPSWSDWNEPLHTSWKGKTVSSGPASISTPPWLPLADRHSIFFNVTSTGLWWKINILRFIEHRACKSFILQCKISQNLILFKANTWFNNDYFNIICMLI